VGCASIIVEELLVTPKGALMTQYSDEKTQGRNMGIFWGRKEKYFM
jgi:hypothetical protein